MRSERVRAQAEHAAAARGTDGPSLADPAVRRHPLARAAQAAAHEAGYGRTPDISSGSEKGFGWGDLNIAARKRQSAADAYLRPVLDRPNLEVVTGAIAHRLTLQGSRCTAIEYSADAQTYLAGAIAAVRISFVMDVG